MSKLRKFIYDTSSDDSDFAQYQNELLELLEELEQELAKLKEENDKYLDIIQGKVLNEAFLEAEIEHLKKYKFMYDGLCK